MTGIRELFSGLFGGAKDVVVARAPGRVNLIGEHTDYNGGWVLPMIIGRSVEAAVRPRADHTVSMLAADFNQRVDVQLGQPIPDSTRPWISYVYGVVLELQKQNLMGRGAEILVQGDVPRGAGLSSSAALELAVAQGLLRAFGAQLEPLEVAKLCQQVEHQYAGVKCGIMDQLVCLLGRAGHALLIDCSSLDYRQVPLPWKDHSIVIVDSSVRRQLGDSGYNLRRQECAWALSRVQQTDRSVGSLREVSPDLLDALAEQLPPPLYARARHVVLENQRVLDAYRCLEVGALEGFGRLMSESHRSLRDDFQVSHPVIDRLVDQAMQVEGVVGARITGGGFGGCTVNLVAQAFLPALERRMQACFKQERVPGSIMVVDEMIEAGVGISSKK